MANQWRIAVSMGPPAFTGLDYTAVRAGFDLAGLTVTPPLWDQVRLIEAGALQLLNGGPHDA